MAWQKGDPWRVVNSLNRLNTQIRTAYPEAVPPATPATSWGSIADDAHSSTSDHYPHYYSALGSTAVVCARDFPHAPSLGLDAHAIAEQLRISRDPRIGYVISNRRITGPNHNWRWDTYSGSDPHDTHIHVSSVHTTKADDTRDWQIGDDVLSEPQDNALAEVWAESVALRSGGSAPQTDTAPAGKVWTVEQLKTIGAAQTQILANLTALAGRDFVNEQAIVDGVLGGLGTKDVDSIVDALRAVLPAEKLAAVKAAL